MKDKLISFETAILAKEKGFNIIQRYGTESSLYDKDGKHIYYSNYGFMYSGLSDGYISAPTQALLQKWLREVHHIEVLIYCNASGWMWELNKAMTLDSFSGGTHIKWSDMTGPNSAGEWDTYEEALEIGLIEGLNRI